ncbi:MAG: hypothetical protein KC543_02845 [Myxococcales bacterium]|nr:hypothetical protein [Myxococcales bacterium]
MSRRGEAPPGEPAPTAASIRARAEALRAQGAQLRAMSPADRAAGIVAACRTLLDARSGPGKRARTDLPASTGLSEPMVEWALQSSLAAVDAATLLAMSARAGAEADEARQVVQPAGLLAVVLAGNVFTAAVRALLVPVLVGVPVLAKASSRDDVFPRLLLGALREAAPPLGAALDVVTFEGGAAALEASLLGGADAVGVYGSDATLGALRATAPPGATFIPHGHGLGVAFVPGDALADPDAVRRVADAVALDVAAYDQRGCLSPHAVLVETTREQGPQRFARALAEALRRVEDRLPRGPLGPAAATAQLQWRGVAAARGLLLEGDGYAVSYEGPTPLRLSPGHRNVSVASCGEGRESATDALIAAIAPLGAHLKALGVAGDEAARAALARRLPAPLRPRVCAVGAMQTPPLDCIMDGALPWDGLLGYVGLT